MLDSACFCKRGSYARAPPLHNDERDDMQRYRGGIGFVMDESRHFTIMDRNARVRLIVAIEALERATKRKGCVNGVITQPGVRVLRALLLKFHNHQTGKCCPSYDAIQLAAALCRGSVANGLRKLERVGVLKVTRRLVRVRDASGTAFARQGVNLYAFAELPPVSFLPPPELKRPRPRVYGMGANQESSFKLLLQPLLERREVGSPNGRTGQP